MSNPLFISYYTGSEYYKNCSDNLKSLCDSLGISIEINEVQDSGEYWKNTLYKPTYILDKIKEKKADLIWIDVDTKIKKYTDCFKKWNSDLLFSSHTGDLQGIKASPIGFKYNERCLDFLDKWSKKCSEKISKNDLDMDHDVLKYEIIPDFSDKISLELMKDGYNFADFSDGDIIENGISRTRYKHRDIRIVMEKNKKRSYDFDKKNLQNYNL